MKATHKAKIEIAIEHVDGMWQWRLLDYSKCSKASAMLGVSASYDEAARRMLKVLANTLQQPK